MDLTRREMIIICLAIIGSIAIYHLLGFNCTCNKKEGYVQTTRVVPQWRNSLTRLPGRCSCGL